MEEDRNSYKSITKSIGIFGGTKIFQILVGIIKNKIIAVLLGPYGMGISGMITSTTDMVFSFSGLGLQTSAVRDVAQAHSSGNQDRINRTITVLRYHGLRDCLGLLCFCLLNISLLSLKRRMDVGI